VVSCGQVESEVARWAQVASPLAPHTPLAAAAVVGGMPAVGVGVMGAAAESAAGVGVAANDAEVVVLVAVVAAGMVVMVVVVAVVMVAVVMVAAAVAVAVDVVAVAVAVVALDGERAPCHPVARCCLSHHRRSPRRWRRGRDTGETDSRSR